jgi:hypothetical protein
LLVPLILRIIDSRKAESMKKLEAAIARQTKIIDAQDILLDDLTKAMWSWRYLLMRVTYAGEQQTEDALSLAWKAYNEKMWESLHAIRVQVTRARRLISQSAYENLSQKYDAIVNVDRHLNTVMQMAPDVRRRELGELNHDMYHTVSAEIDNALHLVAIEVQLVSTQATR